MSRPIILGMNNPRSPDLDVVLLPTGDPGSAGSRLWIMSNMTETQYLRAFSRLNLVNDVEWNSAKAAAAAKEFLRALAIRDGQVVLVLGRQTWDAFDILPRSRKVVPLRKEIRMGIHFYLVPHPSGRNLWYNEENNRTRVGRLLRRLAK